MKKVLKYKVVLGSFIIVSAFLLVLPVHAQEPLVPYDNFNSMFINAEKWKGFDNSTQEIFRYIKFGRLHMYQRSSGSSLVGVNALQFRNPEAVTAMKATIKVNCMKAGSCLTSDDPGRTVAQVQVAGSFFNSSETNPIDQQGDVRAGCIVLRASNSTDPINSLVVIAFINQCTDSFCSKYVNLPGTPIFMGNVDIGKSVTLSVQWDEVNNQFIFQRDNEPPIYYIYYDVLDENPPFNSFKQLCVLGVPLCEEEPQPVTSVEAYFDNVYVNHSAAQ